MNKTYKTKCKTKKILHCQNNSKIQSKSKFQRNRDKIYIQTHMYVTADFPGLAQTLQYKNA